MGGLPGRLRNARDLSVAGQFLEAAAADREEAEVAVAAGAELATVVDLGGAERLLTRGLGLVEGLLLALLADDERGARHKVIRRRKR